MMFVTKLAKLLPAAVLAALFLCWGKVSQADMIFEIDVDTSALTGTTGALDFQFNPASGADLATATANGFTSDGILGAVTITTPPYATGDLSSGLSFNNGEPGDISPINEVQQSFTFGSFFDVFVDLNIPTPGVSDPTTTFGLTIYDQDGNPVQSGFFGDAAVAILPFADGTFFVDSGGPTVTQQPSVIPEPSTFTLTALGLVGLAGVARRQRRTPIGEI